MSESLKQIENFFTLQYRADFRWTDSGPNKQKENVAYQFDKNRKWFRIEDSPDKYNVRSCIWSTSIILRIKYNKHTEHDMNQCAFGNNGAIELHLFTQSWIAPVKSAQSPNIISMSVSIHALWLISMCGEFHPTVMLRYVCSVLHGRLRQTFWFKCQSLKGIIYIVISGINQLKSWFTNQHSIVAGDTCNACISYADRLWNIVWNDFSIYISDRTFAFCKILGHSFRVDDIDSRCTLIVWRRASLLSSMIMIHLNENMTWQISKMATMQRSSLSCILMISGFVTGMLIKHFVNASRGKQYTALEKNIRPL